MQKLSNILFQSAAVELGLHHGRVRVSWSSTLDQRFKSAFLINQSFVDLVALSLLSICLLVNSLHSQHGVSFLIAALSSRVFGIDWPCVYFLDLIRATELFKSLILGSLSV